MTKNYINSPPLLPAGEILPSLFTATALCPDEFFPNKVEKKNATAKINSTQINHISTFEILGWKLE